MTTGSVGQTTFDLTKPTNANAYFAAGISPIATPTVATPVFSLPGGIYGTTTNVAISSSTPGAAIYYTTNGNTPTTSDNYLLNGSSVLVSGVTTLKAIAFASGYNDSAVATATYTIHAPPFVYAGAQQIISSSPATLQGVVTDDDLYTGGGIKFTNWTVVSGPGTATFANANQTNTTVSFDTDGIYVLQLSASDGQYTNSSLVTIAQNTTVSVSLDSPADGATYTVPTNFTLSATASCGSGSITAVAFYANSTLIGTVTNQPYTFDWKSVSAGTLVLTAVATTTDPANTGLASSPATVTVSWPTNVGQVAYSSTDLQLPTAGLPITVNRVYSTQLGATKSFGYNGQLDYEQINIQKSSPLATGWVGKKSGGLTYYVADTAQHLVTVSLSPTEQYYFQPEIIFNQSGLNTITTSEEPNCYDFYKVHLIFVPVGQGQLTVTAPSPSRVGMDDGLEGWTVPLTMVHYESGDGFPTSDYEPDLSAFTFTAPDGTKYNFDSNGNVSQHTDRNGNYLQYSYNGIVHSSGEQVIFDRDPTSGNITAIYDPNSQDGYGDITGPAAVTYAYDSLGNLTNVCRLVDRVAETYLTNSYAYTNTDFPDNVTSFTDPRGVVSAGYAYDASGRLTRQYDALGHYTSYIYDTVNFRTITTDRLGNTTVQNFTAAGELASVQDPANDVTSYAYDSQGDKIAEVNPLGETTGYAYDANGDVIAVTNEIGSVSSSTYNLFGEPLVSIDVLGNGTTNAYDAYGNLLSVTNALNIVTAYGYDSMGDQIAVTNAVGLPEQVVVLNAYDQFGNLTNTVTSNAQGVTLNSAGYTYDANGNRLTETTSRTTLAGQQTLLTQWAYDAVNRITMTIDSLGNTNLTYFNGIGKTSETVDALNRPTYLHYDGNANLTNTTYPDGLAETSAYDAENHKISSTDRGGHLTSYTYDVLGRLIRTTYADGIADGSIFDGAGRLNRTKISAPASGMAPPSEARTILSYFYDAAGRKIATTNALSQGTHFAYDAAGNETNMVDALGRSTSYVFDALNRQIQITYPDNTHENDGYDALSRKIATTNQAGIVIRYGFDALGHLTAVTNAFGTVQQIATHYVYDEIGNLLQQIDANNHTNMFEYDSLGHRTLETQPGGQVATYGYDAVGNLILQTNFNSIVITNQYDVLNRLTNKASINGYKIAFAYSTTGQRTHMLDASGTTSYTYDSRDRLVTKATPEGTLTYTYDGYGNLQTVQSATANGVSLAYAYDSLNRLTNVLDRFTNSTSYGFDAVGNLQTVWLPNNVTNIYAYDSLNRLTNLTAKSISGAVATFAYKLAPFGNRTNLIESLNGVNRTNVWGYDPLYRLTNEVITASASPTGTISYKYDAVGNRTNRTSSVAGITNQTFVYNSNDQSTIDLFDNNGNTKTNSGNVFSYDVENRLTNATVSGTNILIVYDGDGNRVRKIVGTTTNIFLVDDRNPTGIAQVFEEKTVGAGTTNLVRLYTYGLDLISQRNATTTVQNFYGYDGNGNTRYLTATNAAITDTYAYDAFGTVITSTGTTTNFYKYSGQQYDPNLGFYYLRARYMNPNSGRFMSRDLFPGSIFDPSSLHKYNYTPANPINYNDPRGQDLQLIVAVIAVAFVVIIGAVTFYTFSRASGMKGQDPTPQQQAYIDTAKEFLEAKKSAYSTEIEALSVKVDPSLTPSQNEIGNTPGIRLSSVGRIIIGTQFLDGNHPDELSAQIYAEFEHSSVTLGIGLNETAAETDWLQFLQQLGWQNRAPMCNWRHGQGGM